MGAILGFFGAGTARLQALVIAAAAMLAMILALTTWALIERSGKYAAERDAEHFKAQSDVLADSLGRCNAGVENAAKAGTAAIGETKRLLAMAETALLKNAAVRDEIRGIVSRPPPMRADGKPKDCADALGEIRAKVKP
jgi:hypothetical protein